MRLRWRDMRTPNCTGPDAVQYICNHAELTAIACSGAMLSTVLGARCTRCPCTRLSVVSYFALLYAPVSSETSGVVPSVLAGTLPQCPTVKLLVVYGLKSKGSDVLLLPPSPVPGVTIVSYEAVRVVMDSAGRCGGLALDVKVTVARHPVLR